MMIKKGRKLTTKIKFLICLFIIIAVLVSILYIILSKNSLTQDHAREDTLSKIDKGSDDIDYSQYDFSRTYCEGDEDLTYNYITNIQVLDSYKLPYEAYQTLGNQLNDCLQEAGYKSNALKINDVTYDSMNLDFTITMSNSSDIVYCNYDFLNIAYSFIIKIIN